MVVCARCGKDVKQLCSSCWRCESCKLDCKDHMIRVVNGIVGKNKQAKK
jgi:hypothetical protein